MERCPTSPSKRAQTHVVPQGAHTAAVTVDERGVVTGWSDGARVLLGYPPAEILGQQAARLLAEPAGGAWREAAEVPRWSGTAALRHRDGHRLDRDVLVHRRPSGDRPGGREWQVVSAVTGLPPTAAGRPLGEWAFDQSPWVAAVFDEGLRLVRATAGMQRTLSLAEGTMRGLRLTDIAPYEGSAEAESGMRRALDGGGTQELRLRLDPAEPEHEWHVRIVPLADSAGRLRAVALTARSEPSEQLVRQRMLLLSEAGVHIGTTSDVQRTARELTDVAVPAFADICTVDLLDTPRPGGFVFRRAALRSAPGTPPLPHPSGDVLHCPPWSPSGRSLAEGRGAVYSAGDAAVTRWAREDPRAIAWVRESGVHSVMAVPLRAAGVTFGVALFGRTRRAEPFDADDLWLAEQLAARAATGIHGTEQAVRQHTTTMTLQRGLVPRRLPEQAALDIATRCVPSAGRNGTGGDWFDVIPLSGTRVALVVGDVRGHGTRAAATMGRVRTAIRTLADVDLPPDELLSHLDDLSDHLAAEDAGTADDADDEAADGVGTTCLYAVYDPVTRRLAAARAGHPPPAVVTAGAVRFLDVPAGPPLGLGGMPFESYETELPEGSLIALYTNGLLAPGDQGMDDALGKMFAALARPAQSLDSVCDRVLTSMLTHRPHDDIALLVARTRALHADRVATWELPFDLAAVAEARRLATEQLAAWKLEEAAFVTELVVSELVTNAFRYGRPPVRLRLIHDDHTLTSEVFDSSNTAPHMRRAHTFDEGGRGLLLVGRLARRWGTRHAGTGKTVWAEQLLSED
ncbi:PAS domain-containing protein [Streptomyces sp. Ag109_O5-1]|uniref:SpoIIE family protein phosphatase n=1 Tax=Streptomyces sp. Ag109_O5-1 TaxID=1938851 RepID=UPI000F4F5830|nr:SpoIIE family protein phosphatase [Streptomyces sp. Ag109_O5-1]RPE39413.1 PAS domain-containing protein [Streptomyces sp. Ag109_O5-1]